MTATLNQIAGLVVHFSGNKTAQEGIRLSNAPLQLPEETKELLMRYFLQPFKEKETYHFFHDSDLALNEVFAYASAVFDDPGTLYEQSVNLVKHLYENSDHPKIKPGELYVVYFDQIDFNGTSCDAVGLFKSENRQPFLKVYPDGENYRIEGEEGIDIHKLDKGCLIYNSEKENGYVVAVTDNNGKNMEAQFWVDHFLHVRQRADEFFQTRQALDLCRDFVMEKLPSAFEVTKADQADLLNKSVQFFKEKERFNLEEYSREVIGQPEVIEKFREFKSDYEEAQDYSITEDFAISDQAVKKQSRIFKSVIKLDKNFHIYIHGKKELIIKGYDPESGMHYYQLFFKEES